MLVKLLVLKLLFTGLRRSAFLQEDINAILLADTSNPINSLNCVVALHNIQPICPSFAIILINTYRSAADLFIAGDTLLSEEDTTQGDPLAMPMYALSTLPLIECISGGVTKHGMQMTPVPVAPSLNFNIGGNISGKRGLALDRM